MSFQITEFTSYADVRAALGVSEDDLEDETLELDLYADMLEVEFEDVSATFLTTYAAAQATDTPTEAQARFLKATRLFSTYAIDFVTTVTVILVGYFHSFFEEFFVSVQNLLTSERNLITYLAKKN